MSVVMFPTKSKNIISGTTTAEFIPFTKWIPAIAVSEVKTLLRLQDSTAEFQVTAAVQVAATDRTSPGTSTAIGSYLTADGNNNSGVVSLGVTVDPSFWCRFGVLVKNTTGTAVERGQVKLTVSARS